MKMKSASPLVTSGLFTLVLEFIATWWMTKDIKEKCFVMTLFGLMW